MLETGDRASNRSPQSQPPPVSPESVIMVAPQKQYTRELFDKFSYLATWLPGVPLRVGDVGIIREGHFQRLSSLENLGFTFAVRQDHAAAQLDYASRGAVSVYFKAAGAIPPAGSVLAEASAGVVIRMNRENSVLFQALGASFPSIEDQLSLEHEIRRRHAAGEWNMDYLVVTEVLEARAATILIASSSDARVELSVRGNLGMGNVSIADLDAGFEIAHFRGMHTRIVASEGLTPLFRAKRLRNRFLAGPVFRGGEPESRTPDDLEFAALTPDDLG
ncbi:MAG: hypothetical protein ABW277_27455 [Longimicrobiaceae bacterium]